jgi:hypothetical protein
METAMGLAFIFRYLQFLQSWFGLAEPAGKTLLFCHSLYFPVPLFKEFFAAQLPSTVVTQASVRLFRSFV